MICEWRSRLQQCPLLVPVTVLALAVSLLTQVVAHAADGDLDPTFGTGGKQFVDFHGQTDDGWAVAIQSDGKIVVAGRSTPAPIAADYAVARLNVDGSLDPTFGDGGLVTTEAARFSEARAVVIQPDGKILIAGVAHSALDDDFGLARYNSDGSLDTGFGNGGLVQTRFRPIGEGTFQESVSAIVLQSDGRIVAAGVSDLDFALARYNVDGSPDTSFGTDGNGRVVTPLGSAERIRGAALQADGRLVVAGGTAGDFALARYNVDGTLDTTFGSAGIVITDIGGAQDEARSVAILGDGRIVAFGTTATGDVADFALARYNSDGSIDAAFGSGGLVTTDFANSVELAAGMALQADGRIVAVGTSSIPDSPTGSDFAVARYNADGLLDSTFGSAGLVTTDMATSFDVMGGVAIQADGGIVVAGTSTHSLSGEPDIDFALVRYEASSPHTATYFLHGHDVEPTAGGFTMNLTAPSPQWLVSLRRTANWFSDPVATGTFLTGATFEVTLPCTFGVIGVPKTVRLASTDAAGGGEQPLGEAAMGLEFCQSQTFAVPVTTPVALAQRRLKLTVVASLPVSPPLLLGAQTFLRATEFVGTP